jgi:FkbM family methyltransferase
MTKKIIFDFLLQSLSKLVNKKIVYYSTTVQDFSPSTAAKSKYGFWYCGDIFNQSDIAYGVASNGIVEPFDTDLVFSILKNLEKDFTFYDIGSNTGWYSMVSSIASPSSKIFSFEPLKEHIMCQKETLFLNKVDDRVTIFELALSDHEGHEVIRLAGSGTSLEKDFLLSDFGTRAILVTKLDTLVQEKKLPMPHFIKIDVEGYEYKVLQGAKKTLELSKPILFIEIAKTFKNRNFINKDYTSIFTFLESLNYEPYVVQENNLVHVKSTEIADGVAMYLFLNKHTHLQDIHLMKNINLS